MYNEELRETFSQPSRNTVEAYNQITLLILYSISSSSVTLLKVTDTTMLVSEVFLILH